MKKLGKMLRTAKVANIDKNKLLNAFLRRYRETPHTTTGVPPALLLMGYSRSSGLPQLANRISASKIEQWHNLARKNHDSANKRMQAEYDARMRARECQIRLGSLVLIKLKKINKSTPTWDPNPYEITNINGTQMTARRHNHTTTRNSSFFKLYRHDFDDDEPTVMERKETPIIPIVIVPVETEESNGTSDRTDANQDEARLRAAPIQVKLGRPTKEQ